MEGRLWRRKSLVRDGVVMGTRVSWLCNVWHVSTDRAQFVASEECSAPPAFSKAIVAATDGARSTKRRAYPCSISVDDH